MKIYVGNIPYSTTDEELMKEFQKYGEVKEAYVVKDKYSGRSRGFGFVEMPNEEEAMNAISHMDGSEMGGRRVKVAQAKPRTQKMSSSR